MWNLSKFWILSVWWSESRLWQTQSRYFVWYVFTFPYVLLLNPSWKKWTIIPIILLFKRFSLETIDCSRQNKFVKSGTMDIRLEFEFKKNVSANTIAYCLIIHDSVIEYSPMSNVIDTQDYINYHHQKNTLPLFLIYEIKSKILCGQAQIQKVVHHSRWLYQYL